MKEFGPLLGYSIEMEQKKSENPKGPRNSAASWMQILPTVSAYVRSMILNYHDSEDIIQNIAVIFAEKYDVFIHPERCSPGFSGLPGTRW